MEGRGRNGRHVVALVPHADALPLQFMECLIIGRDLVRLLQNVARIPEIELVWKDLLHNPQVLSPQFTGK